MELTDEVLAKAASAGDPDAFAALYGRYADRVRRYVTNRTRTQRDPAGADDLVQEVFTEALASLGHFRPDNQPNSFRRWLFGGIARVVLTSDRRAWWAEAAAISAAENVWHTRGDALDPFGDGELPLSDEWAAAVADLPPAQREVVELRYLEGLPGAQVAAIMGRSESAVWNLALRALRALGRPEGTSLLTQHKRNGTPPLYPTADGWRGYAYATQPDGTQAMKYFTAKTREAAETRWAELSGLSMAEVA